MAKHSSNFTGSETAANLNSVNAKTVTVKAKWKSNEPTIPTGACSGSYGSQRNVNLAVNGVENFDYTGNVVCAYLQKAGYYKLEVWGAKGGYGYQSASGGYGGYSYGKISVSNASALYAVIGGSGLNIKQDSSRAGGYNGGGGVSAASGYASGSAGGATHIATTNLGELKNYSSTSNQNKVLIVAGGGGGGGCDAAGSGGGYVGSNNYAFGGYTSYGDGVTTGGSQTSGGMTTYSGGCQTGGSCTGSFGQGFTYYNISASGNCYGTGGGGWYGGGGGSHPGGGGGSGYIGNSLLLANKGMYMWSGGHGCSNSTATATKTTCTSSTGAHVANAANTGNGYARITYLGT